MSFKTIEERASRAVIGGVRILAGLLWLANLNWKRPPNFGAAKGNGLARWVNSGIKYPVLAPYTWILEHLVRPHLTAFGWMTLLLESSLAALLLIGWRTRIVALVGAGMSAAIALTILHTPNEWPWSYYLMIGLHLLLAATDAGKPLGLDGLRSGRRSGERAWGVFGVVAVVTGAIGLSLAIDESFTAKQGRIVGWPKGELKFVWFNSLGALVCVVIGVLALAAWKLRKRELALAGAALAALAALQVLVQWRDRATGETGGIFGGTGGTLGLWLMLTLGLALTSAPQGTRRPVTTPRPV